MAKFCSECGIALLASPINYCHECGANLSPVGDQGLNFQGNLNGSTVMAAGRDIITHIDGELIDCQVCGGSGEVEHAFACSDCRGAGIIRHRSPIRRGERYLMAEGCRTCGGSGEETQRRDRSDKQSHLRPGSGQVVEMARCEGCEGQGKVRR